MSLAYTTVAYDGSVSVSSATSVALTNSTFVRGPGYGGSFGGIDVQASGTINISNDMVTGLAYSGSNDYSQGINVAQGGTAATTVSGNTVQNADGTAIQVTSPGSVTVRTTPSPAGPAGLMTSTPARSPRPALPATPQAAMARTCWSRARSRRAGRCPTPGCPWCSTASSPSPSLTPSASPPGPC